VGVERKENSLFCQKVFLTLARLYRLNVNRADAKGLTKSIPLWRRMGQRPIRFKLAATIQQRFTSYKVGKGPQIRLRNDLLLKRSFPKADVDGLVWQ
jgi:hypothetical protein